MSNGAHTLSLAHISHGSTTEPTTVRLKVFPTAGKLLASTGGAVEPFTTFVACHVPVHTKAAPVAGDSVTTKSTSTVPFAKLMVPPCAALNWSDRLVVFEGSTRKVSGWGLVSVASTISTLFCASSRSSRQSFPTTVGFVNSQLNVPTGSEKLATGALPSSGSCCSKLPFWT